MRAAPLAAPPASSNAALKSASNNALAIDEPRRLASCACGFRYDALQCYKLGIKGAEVLMDLTQSADSIFRFSTDAIRERDRVAFCRDQLGRRIFRADIEPGRDGPFYAHMVLRALPGLKIAEVSRAASAMRRTPELIAGDEDGLFLNIALTGTYAVSQRGREVNSDPGSALLISCAEPGVTSLPTAGRVLCLRIAQARLIELVPDIDDRMMRPIPRDVAALRLLRSYMGALDDANALATPELQRAVIAHIHELVALAVTGVDNFSAMEREGVRAARLRAIKADIIANLAETRLSARTIARAHGLSPRYVHLLFEQTGQTFGDFVKEVRMKRAFELLTDATRAKMRIGDIAAVLGYADHVTFDRVFRRYFGQTPSDMRHKK
jgi:AraC-like DNA-binding protein